MLSIVQHVTRREVVPPRVNEAFRVEPAAEGEATNSRPSSGLEPISGFLCIIAYTSADGRQSERLITCRSLDRKGDVVSVGAICHSVKAYRQFRTDRIALVSCAETGEVLGDAKYFARYTFDSEMEARPTWGLSASRRSQLVAALNVLAFIARCDGEWHFLEEEPIADFICRLWDAKEWDGEPPVSEILAHARRLLPDAEIFYRSLETLARSTTTQKLLSRAVNELIAADGYLAPEEFDWSMAMQECFTEYNMKDFRDVLEII